MPSNLSTIHLDIVETHIPIIYLKIDKKYSYLKVSKEEGKDQEWIPSSATPDPGHNSQHINIRHKLDNKNVLARI